jgi:hypothetical protein
MEAVGAIAFLQIIMLIIMIWQGIHILVTNRRLKRQRRVLANHEQALTALTVMGLLTDNDWERGERTRRRASVVIEPRLTFEDKLQGLSKPPRRLDPLTGKSVPR